MNIEIHKIHAPKNSFFLKKGGCGRQIDHRVLGGTLKLMELDNIHKVHAPNIQCLF